MRRLGSFVCLVALLAAACSPDDESVESTTSSTLRTTTTTSSTTTTVGPTTTTTMAPTTTTTLAPTTTTAPATTTSAPEVTVELTNEGIYAGSTWVPFGEDDDATVAAVAAVLGSPATDSGWQPAGICPAPNVRSVGWGYGVDVSFRLLFTDANTDFWSGGVQHFFTFQYSGTSDPTDLKTTEGVGIGSTIADLQAAYDPADLNIEESPFDPANGFWSYRLADWTGMWGFTDGQAVMDLITSINGGRGCGE